MLSDWQYFGGSLDGSDDHRRIGHDFGSQNPTMSHKLIPRCDILWSVYDHGPV